MDKFKRSNPEEAAALESRVNRVVRKGWIIE